MRKFVLILLTAVVPLLLLAEAAWSASEVDILVQKLVEKGILTPGEAQQVVAETKEEVRKDLAKGTSASVPQWVQNIKMKGDLRLRYQGERRDIDKQGNGDAAVRDRFRFRLRTGIEAKVLDNMNVAFGLASGSDGDPRSTNQTFQDSFAKKPVWIDYAYAQWTPMKELALTGGRTKNPFWLTSDNLWDYDINPEGAALQASYNPVPDVNLFLNTAAFVVDELNPDVEDPWMAGIQSGADWFFIPGKADAKVAVSWYDLMNQRGKIPDWSAGTNTRLPGGAAAGYAYNFMPIVLDGAVSFQEPFSGIAFLGDHVHFAQIFANGVFNPGSQSTREIANHEATSNQRLGGLLGVAFGDQKVSKLGQWQMMARYEYLEANAWPDFLPDSDTYNGSTNVKGPKVSLQLGLMDNVTFVASYFNSRYIIGPERPQSLWQADLVWKF